MNVIINKQLAVNITVTPKKSKTNKEQYQLYILFAIQNQGIKISQYSISTGITLNVTEFKNGRVIGRGLEAKNKEERINEYFNTAKAMVTELAAKRVSTPTQLLNEIKANAKQRITGKVARGTRDNVISLLQSYKYENVMNRLIADRNISKGRQSGYRAGLRLLNEYFENDIPTLDQLDIDRLQGFKDWLIDEYGDHYTQDTQTDYCSKIAATIKYAIQLKIINTNPLPPLFRGTWADNEKTVVTESESILIRDISDDELSKTLLIAKNILLLQLSTGIAYTDLRTLQYSNIVTDDYGTRIEKKRNKTGITFKIPLTKAAKHYLDTLIELTGNDEQPVNLFTLDYANRMYDELAKKAGVNKNITSYTLRHSFAVQYMENDGRLEDLQKILGHKDIKTTQVYGRISNKRLFEKMNQFETKNKLHQLPTLLKAV